MGATKCLPFYSDSVEPVKSSIFQSIAGKETAEITFSLLVQIYLSLKALDSQ